MMKVAVSAAATACAIALRRTSVQSYRRQGGKCSLCYQRIDAGKKPACVQSCPVGALEMVDMAGMAATTDFRWIPVLSQLNPSVRFITPAYRLCSEGRKMNEYELPLVLFTVLSQAASELPGWQLSRPDLPRRALPLCPPSS